MKVIHKPRQPKKLSLGRRMKASEQYPPVPQRQRFAFGAPIDDGVSYYKIKHLCFNCRKMFRPTDRLKDLHQCPECKGSLKGVGSMFKTPRKEDTRSWKQLEKMFK